MTFWDFCAPIYDIAENTNKKAYNGMLNTVTNLINDGCTVLECAGGTGSISIAVSAKAKHVLCTDVSENMLDVARRKTKRKNIENLQFATCDIYNIDYPNNGFDVVIASQVLHLLNHPKKAANELKRVARKLVVVPVCLTENLGFVSRTKLGLWRLLGFSPRHSFDAEGYHDFLCGIGLAPTDFTVIDGKMPMAVAVYAVS